MSEKQPEEGQLLSCICYQASTNLAWYCAEQRQDCTTPIGTEEKDAAITLEVLWCTSQPVYARSYFLGNYSPKRAYKLT